MSVHKVFVLAHHARKLISRHPWRCIGAMFVVVLSIVDWTANVPKNVYSYVIGILHLFAIIAVLVSPRVGCLAMMAVELLSCFYPVTGGPSRIWGVGFALMIFAYCEDSIGAAAIATVSFVMLQLGQMSAYSDYGHGLEYGAGISLIGAMVASSMAGYICRQLTNAKLKAEQSATELVENQVRQHYEQNLSIAAQLHDNVAGGLTNISLEAQKHLADGSVSADAVGWQLVSEQAMRSLRELHAVIDFLSSLPAAEYVDPASRHLHAELVQWCQKQDVFMQENGLNGCTEINDFGLTDDPLAERERLLFDVLAEIYKDIAKHCKKQGEYHIAITLCDTSVEITQTNTWFLDMSSTSFGKGLQVYTSRLEAAGGSLSITVQDGWWSLYAFIPLS